MKKAIIYCRVSTTEQKEKGYSLKEQERLLKGYCKKNDIEISFCFIEDHSAKDFNRPEFQKLYRTAKAEKDDIDYLFVYKWDRFSRDVHLSYVYLDNFKNLGIEVNAITQKIDHSDPYSKYMLSMYLVGPDVENSVRSERVKLGIRASKKEGRWCANVPIGYIRGRDSNNKPLISINDEIADDIRQLFEDYATGNFTQVELVQKYKSDIVNLTKSKLSKMFRNRFYIGEIYIKATSSEPEQIVNGLHEPLISIEVFNNIQKILKGNRPISSNKSSYDKYLPLRGELLCDECNRKLTGTTKTKKNGKQYSYYHGNSNHKCKCKVSATKLHQQIESMLLELKPRPEIKKLLLEMIKSKSKSEVDKNRKKILSIKKSIASLEDKKDKLLEKYLDDDIHKSDYERYNIKYKDEIRDKTEEIKILQDEFENIEDYFNKTLEYFDNLSSLFSMANPKGKKIIISSILEGKLRIKDKKYRTPIFKDIVKLICSDSNTFKGNKNKKGNSLEKELPRVRTERLELSQA